MPALWAEILAWSVGGGERHKLKAIKYMLLLAGILAGATKQASIGQSEAMGRLRIKLQF